MNSMSFCLIICGWVRLAFPLLLIVCKLFNMSLQNASPNENSPNASNKKHTKYRFASDSARNSIGTANEYPTGFFQSNGSLAIDTQKNVKSIKVDFLKIQ